MRNIKLLLYLFIFIPMYVGAIPQGKAKNIRLQKTLSNTPTKGKRSVDVLGVSAHLNDRVLFIGVYDNCESYIDISVTNLSTGEIIYSEQHTPSSEIVLNMNGLLEEGSDYRLEITIGETILYGHFNL